MNLRTLCAGLLLCGFAAPAHALWMRMETERVPIGRLLTNLQQRLATNQESVATLYQLARVHSMAYATNLELVPVMKKDGEPMFEQIFAQEDVIVLPGECGSIVALRSHVATAGSRNAIAARKGSRVLTD